MTNKVYGDQPLRNGKAERRPHNRAAMPVSAATEVSQLRISATGGPSLACAGLAIQWAMLIGYARVSTDNQETAARVAALKSAGCERIYREKASGGRWDRPALQEILASVRKGDVLVVWKIDRLSRSLRDLLSIMERLGEADARFRSLTEAVDTTTPAGRMMLHIVGSFAEYERAMLHERTRSGLELARQQGRIGGRRPKLTSAQRQKLVRLVSQGTKTAAEAARRFDVHPATVSRLLTRARCA